MKPEANALHVLSTTRAKAKMYEFQVPIGEHIQLPRNPSILFGLAIGILGDTAAQIGDQYLGPGEIPELLRDIDHRNTPFSALFFDAYLNAKLDEEITEEFSLFCSAAYYLSGNPGSSRVVIGQIQRPAEHVARGLSSLLHDLLTGDLQEPSENEWYSKFSEYIKSELASFYQAEKGSEDLHHACNQLKTLTYEDASSYELLYADLIIAICALKIQNASRSILIAYSGLDLESWRESFQKKNFPVELWPAQKKICEAGLLTGRSAVIQMPTSAGKTRATEIIIRSAFLSERSNLAVVVAPYRSLCHDIRNDLTNAFSGEAISVDEATDSYQMDMELADFLGRKTILIVTPEKFLYVLRRNPEFSQRIGLVIYDEGHQFDSPSRGPNYELLLTSLKITLPVETQIILISAVIENASEVALWLMGDSTSVVNGDGLFPTIKRIAFSSWQHARGVLQYVSPEDPSEPEFFVPRVIERRLLAKKPRERADRFFPKRKGTSIGLYLALNILPQGSVAIFCGQKSSASKLCRDAVDLFERGGEFIKPLDLSDEAEIRKIAALFLAHLGENAGAYKSSCLGILPHHANVPQGLRLAIEHAMKSNLAKIVICTSTLAQGVNLPIRYLIITTTQQGKESISIRDFQNLMGRAGRAGMHTEGTILFSSPQIFDEQNQSRKGAWRWRSTQKLLNANEDSSIKSAILECLINYEQNVDRNTRSLSFPQETLVQLAFANEAQLIEAVSTIQDQFSWVNAIEITEFLRIRIQAINCIATFLMTHMDLDDELSLERIDGLVENTLAYSLAPEDFREELFGLFRKISSSIYEDIEGVEQRLSISRSPLPPMAAVRLKVWLTDNIEMVALAVENKTLLDTLWPTIANCISAPAIKKLSHPGLVLAALKQWCNGIPLHEIQAALAREDVRRGRNKITVEHIVDLCENGFAYDISMIVASLADFSEGQNEEVFGALAVLQKKIKYGLSDNGSVAFFEAGFSDRIVASRLGVEFPQVTRRSDARTAVRVNTDYVRGLLSVFPDYFTCIFEELIIEDV